jgi:hypothetical protein
MDLEVMMCDSCDRGSAFIMVGFGILYPLFGFQRLPSDHGIPPSKELQMLAPVTLSVPGYYQYARRPQKITHFKSLISVLNRAGHWRRRPCARPKLMLQNFPIPEPSSTLLNYKDVGAGS